MLHKRLNPVNTPLSLLHRCAVGAILISAMMGGAQASPVLGIVLDTPISSNTSIGPASSGIGSAVAYDAYNSPYTVVETTRVVVKTPPEVGKAGLAWDYLDTTTSYVSTVATKHYDVGYASVSADSSQPVSFNGGKYIQLSGTISTTTSIDLAYFMYANGSYQAITTPFGTAVPTLPAFYFSTGNAALTPTGVYQSADQTNYFSESYTGVLHLGANSSINFNALVYAGGGVSLADFGVNFNTGYYKIDTVDTPHSSTTSQLVGAHLIPALSVPEPATYLMLLGGLLIIGNAASRRRASPLFK